MAGCQSVASLDELLLKLRKLRRSGPQMDVMTRHGTGRPRSPTFSTSCTTPVGEWGSSGWTTTENESVGRTHARKAAASRAQRSDEGVRSGRQRPRSLRRHLDRGIRAESNKC